MKFALTWLALCLAVLASARAEDPGHLAAANEKDLIQTLRSDSPPEQKAMACKELAIFGSAEAVPALAPLLADPELSSWARLALEVIPGPAPDKALRKAAGRLHGPLLAGVINSIGFRKDSRADGLLTRDLKDPDPQVACAAAVALGEIGGPRAAKALEAALEKFTEPVRSSVAEGCVRCAEGLMSVNKNADAVKLCDQVRQLPLPKERILEGIRGAILARGASGIPLLLEQLRSTDADRFDIGLSIAREFPGQEATAAVITAFREADPSRQPALLFALADRSDPSSSLVISAAPAQNGSRSVRLLAIGILDEAGDPASLPVLLEDATADDAQISRAALAALTRFGGNHIESELLARLPDSTGKLREVLFTVAMRRGLEGALPLANKSIADSDEHVRDAALKVVTSLGGRNEADELVHLLSATKSENDRDKIENALVTLSGRIGAACLPSLMPLAQSGDPEDRKAAVAALVSVGGSALPEIIGLTGDPDQSVQDAAVRALCSWPNAWPEDEAVAEPLLKMAETNGKASYQFLALQGYLQFLLGDDKLAAADKLAKLEEVKPLLRRTEDKTTAIAVLQQIPLPASLHVLEDYAEEPGIADEACIALVSAAGKRTPAVPAEERQKALQLVLDKSVNSKVREKAQQALKN